MNLCFLLPVNGLSGGLFVIYEHAKRLREKGHEVHLVFQDDRFPVKITNYPDMQNFPTRYLKDVRASEKFDFAIATWWETAYAISKIPAKNYGYFVQGLEERFYEVPLRFFGPFVQKTLASEFHFFCISHYLERHLSQIGKNASVVLNSINFNLFGPEKATYPRTRKLRVLVEGPVSAGLKRVPFAFSVLREIPEVEVFALSADGSVDPEARVDRLFTKVPYAEVPPIYASCDILLKLSSQESFGLPILEMFASGGTAIVTAFTGHNELVRDGENGLVVPIDDKAAAVAAVKRLIDDPALLAKLKAGAKETCSRFSWEKSNDAFERRLLQIDAETPADRVADAPVPEEWRDAHEDIKRFDQEIHNVRAELGKRSEELHRLMNSHAWKIGRAATWPIRKMRETGRR